ncbi:O-antigen ligase family protein [Flavobacterium flavigenum]|uniref:O-antigen ligase family protein n=1 Tax=Flavobacterium flavigenum TaxID=3003258 RepID=UPI0022AC33A6|nr:O-antigen ligase family protein [Flavobacterium flavigenum]
MSLFKTNSVKIVFIVTVLITSLIFNHDIDFWKFKQNQYIVLFYMIVFSFLLFIIKTQKIKFNKLDLIIILVLFITILSRFFRLNTFNEIHIINSFVLIIYFLAIKSLKLSVKEKNFYYQLLTLTGVFLCLYCLLELGGYVNPSNIYWNMKGNFPNPGPLAGFLSILFALVLYELFQKNIYSNIAKLISYLFSAIIMIFIIIKSESRTAILASFSAFLILLYYYYLRKRVFAKYAAFAIIFPILFLIITIKSTDSIAGRLLIWKISFFSFLEKPVMGIGYGMFQADYMNFQAEYFSKNDTQQEILLANANTQAFNEVLKFIIENGIIGTLLLLIGVLWISKNYNKKFTSAISKTSVQSIVFYCSFAIFASFSYPLQFLPFKLLLLNQIALQETTTCLNIPKIKTFSVKIIGCCMSLFLLFIINKQYKAFRNWKEASELQFDNPTQSANLYKTAFNALENDDSYLIHYSRFFEETNPTEALSLLEKAKETGNSPLLQLKLAKLYEAKRDFEQAEKSLLQRHYTNPHLFKPQEDLLDYYIRRSLFYKANWIAKRILQTPIKIPSEEVKNIITKAKHYINNNN